jgi:hypothetical protein
MSLKSLAIMAIFAASAADSSIDQIAASGRCATLGENPDLRVSPAKLIAPGQPPILSFRFYEGKAHHRFGNSELLLDDAGH